MSSKKIPARYQSTTTIGLNTRSTSRVTITEPADEDEDYIKETHRERFQRYAKMVLPHIGLVVLLGTYTVCGAGVFHMLEAPYEQRLRAQSLLTLSIRRQALLVDLWNMTANSSLSFQQFNEYGLKGIEDLELWLVMAFDQHRISLRDLRNDSSEIWTFQAAIFFASTVITTIGYGHVTPMTLPGRIFCIGFGLFGIPLLLITIADIGKFLSDLITFIYKSYRRFKLQLRRKSRKISFRAGAKPFTYRSSIATDLSSLEDEEDMRIPVWMVLLFLATYTALGGLLFQFLEGWDYFEAFYFCFITMATIGFGDLVPSKEMYMFFNLIYIVIGLAVTTMCIDLAGTEYIRKIHYFGQKMEGARDLFETGLHVGGDLMKQMQGIALLRKKGLLPEDYPFESIFAKQELMGKLYATKNNILYEPVAPAVWRHVKPGIKLTPDEIDDSDAWVLENKMFGRPTFRKRNGVQVESVHAIGHVPISEGRRASWPRNSVSPQTPTPLPVIIAPFILRESVV